MIYEDIIITLLALCMGLLALLAGKNKEKIKKLDQVIHMYNVHVYHDGEFIPLEEALERGIRISEVKTQ